jgi:hypothetical protein
VNLDLTESRLLKLVDEVTLRQGPGHSAGPCGRVRKHLWREFLVADSQV